MKRSGFAAARITSRTRWGESQKPRSSSGARPPSPQTRKAVARCLYLAGTSSATASSCKSSRLRKGTFIVSHCP
eukprot:261779-Alexandrium_andersonii.AAC.1